MDLTDIQFRHPFTCLCAGPTGSGKTIFTRNLLSEHKRLIDKDGRFNVLYCYGQRQSLFDEPLPVNIKYHEGLPDVDKFNGIDCVIIDDLMIELGNSAQLANMFTKMSHHMSLSVIFLVQNIFHKAPLMRTISLNCHYIVLFKNARDRSQVFHLARQLYPHKPKIFLEAYVDSTAKPYTYIRADCHPKSNDKFRLLSRLTSAELKHLNIDFSPIVYIPIDNVQKSS